MTDQQPGTFIVFGSDANCTLKLCPVEWSIYKYRPSLIANGIFIALYALAIFIHTFLGFRWKMWFYMIMMVIGSLVEIVGYVGRIVLHSNPWSFVGFLIQVISITCGPVFYTAAVYVTLSRIIQYLAPNISRFQPKAIWWIFIPTDLMCLVLQAAGGALSAISNGSSQTGVDIAIAGLGLQVAVLVLFCVLLGDYLYRYCRSASDPVDSLTMRMRLFFGFLSLAVILILGRCAFRCYELSDGYRDSNLITDQALFIALEGCLVTVSIFCLCIAHPGLVFHDTSTHEKTKIQLNVETPFPSR